ncbi:unnamed protein product [Polarella glacialis]|uniref:CCHC-type domain-containing protein n=1 Tax=Polarella glacialis TaxID=89957 RepID=A0A813FVM6_POLGL|nr:unnamed protein product [Polarella glacialis]CAE8739680.1 unnamed protein product [Polarella glacialis]
MGKRGGGQLNCWHCGGKGHTQGDCELLLASSAGKKCFVCGSTDHLGADCPQKVEAEANEAKLPAVKRVIASKGPAEAFGQCSRMSVLITTSPVPSNPSTMMIEAVMNTFSHVAGLKECPLVIVCDGYRFAKGDKSTWKAGKVTEDSAERYLEYLENLELLLNTGRLPAGTRIVVLDGRNGQAMAVKAGLAEVETPYVLVHQHDLEFTFDFNLEKVLDVLDDDTNSVKYVGLPLLVNLHYESIAWQHHGVRVKKEAHKGVDLVPVIFWYDSTHITSVRHYQTLVFGPEEVYTAGNFVEETFGVRQRNDVMAKGMDVHAAKYGTYHCLSHALDGSRRPLIMHLNGVRFLTPEQRAARGYPADPPVEFFPSRVLLNRKQRKLKHILDAILGLAGMLDGTQAGRVKDILSKLINETRVRCSELSSTRLLSKS